MWYRNFSLYNHLGLQVNSSTLSTEHRLRTRSIMKFFTDQIKIKEHWKSYQYDRVTQAINVLCNCKICRPWIYPSRNLQLFSFRRWNNFLMENQLFMLRTRCYPSYFETPPKKFTLKQKWIYSRHCMASRLPCSSHRQETGVNNLTLINVITFFFCSLWVWKQSYSWNKRHSAKNNFKRTLLQSRLNLFLR